MVKAITQAVKSKVIFYFTFQLDGETETFGFAVRKAAVLYETMGLAGFDELTEVLYDQGVEDLESRYGVHDWSSSPSDGVNGIGFTSYEVARDAIPALLAAWQAWFTARGATVTPYYRVPMHAANDDAAIYRSVMAEYLREAAPAMTEELAA